MGLFHRLFLKPLTFFPSTVGAGFEPAIPRRVYRFSRPARRDDSVLARVEADPDRLIQVLTNLLSNAANFSPPESLIQVSIERRGAWIRVTVSDSGSGIPDAFRGQVFEKFAQADASDSRQKSGTGLGLSISKAIIEKLGGRIDFETTLGKGSQFFFELPELRTPLDAAASSAREDLPHGDQ